MNQNIRIVLVVLIVVGIVMTYNNVVAPAPSAVVVENNGAVDQSTVLAQEVDVLVAPIKHASFVMQFGDIVVYNDPVGELSQYEGQPDAQIILVTDIHGDHLDVATLEVLAAKEGVVIIAPPAVVSELSPALQTKVVAMENGAVQEVKGLTIEAIAAYNIPESDEAYHVKGRGNGYVVSQGETRVYIAGDTSDTPEMRALTNIDIAFVPMNLPYTMTVEAAASAVLEFKPSVVYPYHYRGTEGFSDIALFTSLVEAGDASIEVREATWY